ncbi:hypothetical protein [Alicyclobacillus sp. ALC3]|uniref:hypothetical protein n=1 Tax=Alicyclobacillus sp. ALC3 TaxID=2796143 RepID=UPI0023798719|nr:hypothetical protein [Alicyclobacillus sp. ALC3]WDL98623.1 hypothetical protein JC200_08140 [Alicyclobacillus sp. ALC3]
MPASIAFIPFVATLMSTYLSWVSSQSSGGMSQYSVCISMPRIVTKVVTSVPTSRTMVRRSTAQTLSAT